MRDQYEIVYVDARGAEQVLSRIVPNGYAARWKVVKKHAARVLKHPVDGTLTNPRGMTFVVASVNDPDDGYVGIRERA